MALVYRFCLCFWAYGSGRRRDGEHGPDIPYHRGLISGVARLDDKIIRHEKISLQPANPWFRFRRSSPFVRWRPDGPVVEEFPWPDWWAYDPDIHLPPLPIFCSCHVVYQSFNLTGGNISKTVFFFSALGGSGARHTEAILHHRQARVWKNV